MIVSRAEFERILAAAKGDRMGLVSLSELDTAKVVAYARHMLPVLIQAQRLYLESGGAADTPCRASLVLALHHADPEFFQFDDCDKACRGRHCFREGCDRLTWLHDVRRRAHTPLAPRRAWWKFWRRAQ